MVQSTKALDFLSGLLPGWKFCAQDAVGLLGKFVFAWRLTIEVTESSYLGYGILLKGIVTCIGVVTNILNCHSP